MNYSLAGYIFLLVESFSFHHLKYAMPFPLTKVSAEKLANSLMGVLLYVTFLFLLLRVCLSFAILIAVCLGVNIFGVILLETLHCFPDLNVCFLSQVKEVFSYYFSNKFSALFSLSSFWDPYNANVNMINVVPETS